jgi:uncharacterized membrane protein YedE/YeeE
MLLMFGGFACGFAAGAAARYGRLCTMSAIEDAVIARDWRAAKAWGLALATAIVLTHAFAWMAAVDLTDSVYAAGALDLAGALGGGLVFGLGMALVGTCSFGLLVRAGSGDLRAAMSAAVVGVAAFAFTAGVLSPVRMQIAGLATIDLRAHGGPLLPGLLARWLDQSQTVVAAGVIAVIAAVLLAAVVRDPRLARRPRLLVAAIVLGSAIAAGWAVTAVSIDRLEGTRLESLSFVAPAGRLLLQLMSDTLRDVGFGVASVLGVVCGAGLMAIVKDEVRWEAFDDVREMRRHLLGAVLMGLGGVMARGCTIGQGMSAASVLAVSAPIVMLGILIGARIGLAVLLEGRSLWRVRG